MSYKMSINKVPDETTVTPNMTPFALHSQKLNGFDELIRKDKGLTEKVLIQQQPSALKLFESPAYTLAPITKIAPIFIRTCLLPKYP